MSRFYVLIRRKHAYSASIIGEMYVNGSFLCYTLELPWRWNQRNVSCIPRGAYSGFIRYDKPDGWRIQLQGVPNRSGVQIHIGNYPSDIKGCVLVGTSYSPNAVWHSRKAYEKLRQAFYGDVTDPRLPSACPAKDISVEFAGIFGPPVGDFPSPGSATAYA